MSFLHILFQTIQDRKANPKQGSYTNTLFEWARMRLRKVGEGRWK